MRSRAFAASIMMFALGTSVSAGELGVPSPHAPESMPSHGISALRAQSGSSWLTRQLDAFRAAYEAFDQKLGEAAHVDEQNELLRKRIAQLEAENAELRARGEACREQTRVEKLKAEAVAEGGLTTSRTIASLHTSDKNLLNKSPDVIFREAVTAFSSGDFETSGKALTALVDSSEGEEFRTAQTYYLAGVSLYQVGDYKRAIDYFTRSDQSARGRDETYSPRALAWIALCHGKLGDERAQSATIHQLIQRYPKSKEARRLNRNA